MKKSITDLNIEIIDSAQEQIKINELEFVLHTNKKYLNDLQNIYLKKSNDDLTRASILLISKILKKKICKIYLK